jgi:hypothetical protein
MGIGSDAEKLFDAAKSGSSSRAAQVADFRCGDIIGA